MQFDIVTDDRDRLVRLLVAGVFTLVAVDSFRKGRRFVGALAGVGAVGVGYSSSGEPSAVKDTVMRLSGREIPILGKKEEMRCSTCSEPILAGQVRQPNAENETVHEHCL